MKSPNYIYLEMINELKEPKHRQEQMIKSAQIGKSESELETVRVSQNKLQISDSLESEDFGINKDKRYEESTNNSDLFLNSLKNIQALNQFQPRISNRKFSFNELENIAAMDEEFKIRSKRRKQQKLKNKVKLNTLIGTTESNMNQIERIKKIRENKSKSLQKYHNKFEENLEEFFKKSISSDKYKENLEEIKENEVDIQEESIDERAEI